MSVRHALIRGFWLAGKTGKMSAPKRRGRDVLDGVILLWFVLTAMAVLFVAIERLGDR